MSSPARAFEVAALLALLAACTTDAAPPAEHGAAAQDAAYVCPPCGMSMPEDSELREIGGLHFALCNELCAEKVAADPERYAERAVER